MQAAWNPPVGGRNQYRAAHLCSSGVVRTPGVVINSYMFLRICSPGLTDYILGDYRLGLRNTMNEERMENGIDSDDDLQLEEIPDYLIDRRRAKSLPAYPEQVNLYHQISQNCRKRVKFADALGLNLASVRHFSTNEDPQIPAQVLSRLKSFSLNHDRDFMDDLCVNLKTNLTQERLVPAFKMPVDSGDLETRLTRCCVALESVTVTQFDVRGIVRAMSTSNRREVGVRYTFNDWLSSVDAQAILMPTEHKTHGERFSFTVYTPPFLDPSASVHFAVYMKDDNCEFWDNNDGLNYSLKYSSTSCETEAYIK
ncbi:protein phosphatase 1 regulatory subunit 3D-like [Myxocyprinus asiaticus]|uniref:protein phosphatase 1 regulatory subunit 3D-like n=1 Tax=Myxocyprinus asiaticus TaxID=70543 RepID=UPI002222395F|nr:protein phosphatase 1 regulatory subunit 3D-like [Myxocyprinus asiaticus]